MKVIICFVLLNSVLCELPPPYPSKYFKTSSYISPSRYLPPNGQQTRQPQTVYGPPPSVAEPLDPSFVQPSNPSKLRSLGNFQRLPQLRDTLRAPNPSQNAFLQPVPQRIYGPPNINNFSPQNRVPQTTYGPPKILNSLPQTTYGAPDKQINLQNQYNLASFPQNILPQTNYRPSNQQQEPTRINSLPQTTYGVPDKQINFQNRYNLASFPQNILPQTNYRPSNQQQEGTRINSLPQTTYGVPDRQINLQNQNKLSPFLQNPLPQTSYITSNQQQEPARNYGTPSVDAATLEEIRQLRLLIQKIEAQRLAQQNQQNQQNPFQQNTFRDNRHGQSLPNKEAGTFRLSLSEQYLPVKEPDNFKKDVPLTFDQEAARNLPQNNNKYIPPRREQPKNTWNNLDLPAGTSANVDIRKVEVTQFGPNRNANKNNNDDGVRNDNDNNGGEVNNKYIPPSTTISPADSGTFPTTEPSLDSTTPESSYQLSEDTFAGSPNIALATPSLQGLPDNQQWYLLHPDGRYQKVVTSKNRLQSNRQNHQLSSYQIYQHLQVDPNVIYAPVYSVLTQ